MEDDLEPEKPAPKPKPKPKAGTKVPKGDEDEPTREQKKMGRSMGVLPCTLPC
jgi:hypothetical protein